jgi:hypothetical protein
VLVALRRPRDDAHHHHGWTRALLRCTFTHTHLHPLIAEREETTTNLGVPACMPGVAVCTHMHARPRFSGPFKSCRGLRQHLSIILKKSHVLACGRSQFVEATLAGELYYFIHKLFYVFIYI